MQRLCRLRSAGPNLFERLYSSNNISHFSSRCFALSTPHRRPILRFQRPIHCTTLFSANFRSLTSQWHPQLPIIPSNHPIMVIQKQSFASKKKEPRKLRVPPSKLKKTKMKCYSSMKFRFKTLANGDIRRWRAGKRHNAHSKSKKSKRRLRQPALVSPAYAKVMKRLNFCG
uniref:50S ribosomal protein L35 n=1 Tax=Araucaria cunninghamii TaxID=56994 RepID=A0A0D6QSK0_ARACU